MMYIDENRLKQRKDIVNILGSRELRKTHFTLTCNKPDIPDHWTCVSKTCLCPCHDKKLLG